MWIKCGEGILNLSRADWIKAERTRQSWRVVAHIAGAHAVLAIWPTQEEADNHVALLKDRLNRTRAKA